jgi:glycosyltransferase involved in cell wall biosynthesis
MKILMSAYACDPYAGSEPGVGFGAMKAAASRHELWLMTRANNVTTLSEWLRESELNECVHLVGLDIPGSALTKKGMGLLSLHRYYDLWQRAAGDKGRELHDAVGFDVVHHVTFASYWTRTGVAAVPAPLVWGPVGGGVRSPSGLLTTLGVRGLLEEIARVAGRRLASIRYGAYQTAGQAAVTLAQNRPTAHLLERSGRRIQVLPNATVANLAPPSPSETRSSDVMMVGRLVSWKAGVLAVRALRYLEHPEATLVIVGDGPDKDRIRRAVRRWHVEDRVVFKGRLPRAQVLQLLARCGVLVHPALHEEGGLAVAEALRIGTPVVCLDWGGPAGLASIWQSTPSTLVRPTTPDRTARAIAAAIDAHLAHPPNSENTVLPVSLDFETEVLGAYEKAAEDPEPTNGQF